MEHSLPGISLYIKISVLSYDIKFPFNFSFQFFGLLIAPREKGENTQGKHFLFNFQDQL